MEGGGERKRNPLSYLVNLVSFLKKIYQKTNTNRNSNICVLPRPFLFKFVPKKKPTFKSICFSLGVRYILFSQQSTHKFTISASSSSQPTITSSCCCKDWGGKRRNGYQSTSYTPWGSTITTRLEELYFMSLIKHQALCRKTNKTYLCYLVVVGKEHGEVLGFLNGLRICHFPQELSSSLKTEIKTVFPFSRTTCKQICSLSIKTLSSPNLPGEL